jgi:acyl-CoA synthetase (AMP-forming)/AMP-acid ligase II
MAEKQDAFFQAERTMLIPTKDILSWTFDDPQFDQEKKVSDHIPVEMSPNTKLS